ncbi:MAG: ribbon-helix-helix domain-containing protein [Clostridiales bacterium]
MGKTSTAANNRYKAKSMIRIVADIPRETGERFKEKCRETGIPQAQIIKKAIDEFLKNE